MKSKLFTLITLSLLVLVGDVNLSMSQQKATTTNADIQRLQKNPTVAQSGNYGRTPGGIVDLRTGQIVAPSSTPILKASPLSQQLVPQKQSPPAIPQQQFPQTDLQRQRQAQQAELQRQQQAIQQELARKQRELAEAQKQQAQQTELQRQRQALQQELARKQKELSDAQQRQGREAAAKQPQAKQAATAATAMTNPDVQRLQKDPTVSKSGNFGRTPGGIVDLRTGQIVAPSATQAPSGQQQAELERRRQALQQELARKQKELNELQQRQAREAAAKQQQVQQTPLTSTPTINADIQRLQRDPTVALSGNYGRTPGGIVDLRTGQIVAPPSAPTSTPTTARRLSDITGESRTPSSLANIGGAFRNNTAGSTPATIGINLPPAARGTPQALGASQASTAATKQPLGVSQGTSSTPLSADDRAKMEATLERRRRLLETGLPNLQAINELGLADKALKEGKLEDYKRHLEQSWKLTEAAADAASEKAYKNYRLLHPGWDEAKLLVPQYGNYGGPGWTGGWSGMLEKPINKMDEAFKRHDEKYGTAKTPEGYINADRQLVADLRTIKSDDLQGKTYFESVDKDMRYRENAIRFFEGKISSWERMPTEAMTRYLADKMGPDPTNSTLYRASNWMDKPAVQRALQPIERTLTGVEMGVAEAAGLGRAIGGRIIRGLQDLVD